MSAATMATFADVSAAEMDALKLGHAMWVRLATPVVTSAMRVLCRTYDGRACTTRMSKVDATLGQGVSTFVLVTREVAA